MARKASVNPALIRSLRDLMSLPPDGYQGLLEEYRRLRLEVREQHEAQLYLGMQAFRMWLLITNHGKTSPSEDEICGILKESLDALESQDHNGYQRLRSKLKAFSGGEDEDASPLRFFAPRIAAIQMPRFQKGDEIPKPEDILVSILYDAVVYPLAKDLAAEDWQAQSLKESMAMKAALWAATESNTTRINREQKQKATAGQLALWAVAFVMVVGMTFIGLKMGGYLGKTVDPALAMTQAKSAMKNSDFPTAIVNGELALDLLQQRNGTKKDTRPVREFLVEAYVKNGQKDEAREYLVGLKNDFPKEKRYQKRLKELEAKPKPKKKSKK